MEAYAIQSKRADWMGSLPPSWRALRISSLYDSRNEKVSDKDFPPLSVTMGGIVPQIETAAKTQDGDNRKLVKVGDFAINSRSDRRGSCGISPFEGSVSLITNVLMPHNDAPIDPRFFGYLFKTEGFADEYYKYGTGIVDDLWSTNWSRMKDIQVAVPPLHEQSVIADFLDEKTAEIDSIVEEAERSIGLLREYRRSVISEAVTKGLDPDVPMRDSGVDWIGETPEGWKVSRIGWIANCLNGDRGVNYPSGDDMVDDGIPFIVTDAIHGNEVDISRCKFITKSRYDLLGGVKLEIGDIVYCLRGSVGQCAINLSTRAGTVASSLMAVRPFGCKPSWLNYVFSSELVSRQVDLLMNGTCAANLSAENVSKFRIALPDLSVQSALVDYLDAKTAEIDALIADKERQVELLKEYRKSLISEAVTGKFKVPGVE